MRRLGIVVLLLGVTAVAAPAGATAATRSCGSVSDPYAGTRYEGVDLSAITASGVSCRTAKRVARGAHRKALGITPPPSGMRTYSWDGWRVTGDLRGSSDRYVATKAGKRVRWRF